MPQPRWRLALATVIAGSVGILVVQLWLVGAQERIRTETAERSAVIAANAFTSLAERLGIESDEARSAVEALGSRLSGLETARAMAVEGTMLVASTETADEAPRRLRREEKPLFDQAQRLRASIRTNTEEGVYRKEEIELDWRGASGLTVAAPVEDGDSFMGMIKLEIEPPPPRASSSWTIAAGLALVPVLVMLALVSVLGGRRWLGLLAAALLLAGAIAGYSRIASRAVHEETRAAESRIADRLSEVAAASGQVLSGVAPGQAADEDPALWDTDRFRRPRKMLTAAARVDEARLSERLAQIGGRSRRVMLVSLTISGVLLAFVGLGWARRTWNGLVAYRVSYSYTAPALIGMLVLVFFPFFYGIALSFTEMTLYKQPENPLDLGGLWIGLSNYVEILGDFSVFTRTAEGVVFDYSNFYWTAFITLMWTVTNVAFGVSFGLLLALILNQKQLRFKWIYRVLLILPWAVPNYITALIWQGMFHQQFGVINQVLQMAGGSPISWFDSPFTSFLTALATNGWLSFPFMMVVSLGALQSIPAELYEAARVDGASRWQQFSSITLPSLKPALVPAVILSVIWTFNMFNVIYLVTGGQPAGATEILVTKAYKIAFEEYQYGYAAAYSTVIFLILLVYGTWQNRVTRATEGI
jgi:arabinogalactan oligomer/maltooligosaccharide transport system permease protein